jgi:hypothetical protein
MEEDILAYGLTIICMVMVSILGKMVGNTMATTKWIRNMAMEYIFGQTVDDMKETGLMENNMDKVNTSYQMVQ